MRILLHACCGPCLLMPAAELASRYDSMAVFWYNPNVHPSSEYARREENLRAAAMCLKLPVLSGGDYDAAGWLAAAGAEAGPVITEPGGARCHYCLRDRLRATAQAAAAGGYEAYSSTMLYSPYLDHDFLRQAGQEEGIRVGVVFYAADWRAQFRAGQDRARKLGLYRQNYCGCIYSENERYQRKRQRAIARVRGAA